jgi:hypothetical protein
MVVPAVVAAVVEAVTPDTAPLPDEAYRRLDYAERRVPAQGWRAELDVTTEAVEGRVLGQLGRRATVAGFVHHGWDGETTAGVRVGVPL